MQWCMLMFWYVMQCFLRRKEAGWWGKGLFRARGIKMVQLSPAVPRVINPGLDLFKKSFAWRRYTSAWAYYKKFVLISMTHDERDDYCVRYRTAALTDRGVSQYLVFTKKKKHFLNGNCFKISTRIAVNRCTSRHILPYTGDGNHPFGFGISVRSTTILTELLKTTE